RERREASDWFPEVRPADVILTAGASCPDALLEQVMCKIVAWFESEARSLQEVLAPFADAQPI
ncbi:MAG TPA: 4-hydroxy-3-methylbut-2-enyl diphosphate reductase, partial [Rhodothermales bacterium]|nr:4-hydroxy-3-methylbut-2-enyl diphosphate reductase [Rhodothermales bacterium]